MEKAQIADDAPGIREAFFCREFGGLPQADRRKKKKNEPRAGTNVSRVPRSDQAGGGRDGEHRDRGQAPTAIQSGAPRRAHEDDDRRKTGDEKQNAVEIEHEPGGRRGVES